MAVSFITPKYIYKILPPTPPPPSPLPLALPVSALDARDNFIHLSTSRQVIGTLRNFFANEDYVWMLRIPYTQVEKWIKWENSVGKGPDEPVRVIFFILKCIVKIRYFTIYMFLGTCVQAICEELRK